MQHAEFLNDPASRLYDWRLTDWPSAVRVALGDKALRWFQGAFVVLLAPAVLLAAYSLYCTKFELIILVLLSFWGFWTSSTSPTGIGLAASMFTAIVGLAVSTFSQDTPLAFSSVLPGVTWLGSCAILGTTAQYVLDALRSSEATFQDLVRRGIIVATPKADDD